MRNARGNTEVMKWSSFLRQAWHGDVAFAVVSKCTQGCSWGLKVSGGSCQGILVYQLIISTPTNRSRNDLVLLGCFLTE